MRTCFFFFGLSLVLLAPLRSFGADPSDTTYVRFNTTLGNIDVQLLTHEAPQTVANFLYYVNNTTNTGNYSNVIINRNVPGFVFQGGAFNLIGAAPNEIALNPLYPTGTGVPSEAGVSNTPGTLAMALSANQTTSITDPNSGTDQWFFNLVDNSGSPNFLDAQGFTVFGIVANSSSLAVMQAIGTVQPFDQSVFFNEVFNLPDNSPFGSNFDAIPMVNYTSGSQILISNLVLVNSITQLTVQNFATWQTAEFTPTQQGTPNFTGPANTPFNDLVPNLLKYVFNINPSRPMSNADRAALPIVKTTTTSGTTTATYTFRKYAKLIDATATVQTSTDLHTWTTLATAQTGTDSTTGDPIMQAQVVSPAAKQFFRLNVTQP